MEAGFKYTGFEGEFKDKNKVLRLGFGRDYNRQNVEFTNEEVDLSFRSLDKVPITASVSVAGNTAQTVIYRPRNKFVLQRIKVVLASLVTTTSCVVTGGGSLSSDDPAVLNSSGTQLTPVMVHSSAISLIQTFEFGTKEHPFIVREPIVLLKGGSLGTANTSVQIEGYETE